MKSSSGSFVCPRCNSKGMNGYTNYLNRIKYIKNNAEIIWIFYKKFIYDKKKCKCRYLNFFKIMPNYIMSTIITLYDCLVHYLYISHYVDRYYKIFMR